MRCSALAGLAAAIAALALAGCATVPTAGAPGAAAVPVPSTPLGLGDWRRAGQAETAQAFEREVAAHYRAGAALSAVSADLRRNEFNCAANRDGAGRGDPPAQICRKTLTFEGCTHTWQVHVFDSSGALTRARALYDRRCGGDGLLGGPN